MNRALFDSITNSEDEMILRTGIKRYHACTYLRAYIMASLCFEPRLVISDSAVNLNRAFRTLIDYEEGAGNYKLEYLPKADFDWLIRNGHIRFAARDTYKGDFSEALRVSQKNMKGVDLPSERYTRRIDEICSNEYVYWYNLDDISHRFTYKFMNSIKDELKDANILPEREKLLRKLIYILSDKETITYNGVKTILLKDYREEDDEYKYVRRILRQSYDYNVPELLDLDYCMPLQGIKPSRDQDWKLKVAVEQVLECDFACSVYGFAALPVSHLKYIWEGYDDFERQINCFQNGTIELNEYMEALSKYILRINDVVRDVYTIKNNDNDPYKKGKLSSLPIAIRHYCKTDDTSVVIAKILNDAWNLYNLGTDLGSSILDLFFSKFLPNLAKKKNIFPEPPEEINEAIIVQNKEENDNTIDSEYSCRY